MISHGAHQIGFYCLVNRPPHPLVVVEIFSSGWGGI